MFYKWLRNRCATKSMHNPLMYISHVRSSQFSTAMRHQCFDKFLTDRPHNKINSKYNNTAHYPHFWGHTKLIYLFFFLINFSKSKNPIDRSLDKFSFKIGSK